MFVFFTIPSEKSSGKHGGKRRGDYVPKDKRKVEDLSEHVDYRAELDQERREDALQETEEDRAFIAPDVEPVEEGLSLFSDEEQGMIF